MVAISDMKKPKSCIKCDVHIAHDYCDHFSQFGVGAKTDGVYSDCPLIDIVECWECEFYQGDGSIVIMTILQESMVFVSMEKGEAMQTHIFNPLNKKNGMTGEINKNMKIDGEG